MSLENSLSQNKVRHLWITPPLIFEADTPLSEVIEKMRKQSVGCAIICAEEKVKGIFTEKDALRKLKSSSEFEKKPVKEFMTSNPTCVTSDSTIRKAADIMNEGGFRHLPVINEKGIAQGSISIRNIITYLSDHFPEAVYNQPPDPDKLPLTPEGA